MPCPCHDVTPLSQAAHVALPALHWTEKDGTYELKRLRQRAYRVRAESPNAVAQAIDDVPSDTPGDV